MAIPPTESNSRNLATGHQTTVKLEPLDELISPLSPQEQLALRHRHPVVLSISRRFVSRILVAAPATVVWDTLTDYSNFSTFLPTVVSSQIVKSEGDRHIVEQIDSRTILMASVRTIVRTENIEIPQKRINFRLVGGDMNKFDGHWQIYPVLTSETPNKAQTLLLQSAEVEAGPAFFEGIVHSLIADSLRANVTAIRNEAEKRSRS